jgi:hypothetical protein
VGLVLPSFRRIGAAVSRLGLELPKFHQAVAKIQNRAAFEIPGILDQILSRV